VEMGGRQKLQGGGKTDVGEKKKRCNKEGQGICKFFNGLVKGKGPPKKARIEKMGRNGEKRGTKKTPPDGKKKGAEKKQSNDRLNKSNWNEKKWNVRAGCGRGEQVVENRQQWGGGKSSPFSLLGRVLKHNCKRVFPKKTRCVVYHVRAECA